MKSQLKRLGISYKVIDFRKAKQMGMNIQSTPTLVAFSGSHPTAYMVGGAYTDSQVIEWINQFAKPSQEGNDCEDGMCPIKPDEDKQTKEPSYPWLIWLAIIAIAIFIALKRN